MKERWDDGLLVAYVDGELDDATARAVEAWVAADPDSGATLRRLHDSAGMLRAACGGPIHDPCPEIMLLLEQPAVTAMAAAAPPADAPPPSPWRRPAVIAAVLAALALGTFSGAVWGGAVALPVVEGCR
jgi:anti-sigma factor RsiW